MKTPGVQKAKSEDSEDRMPGIYGADQRGD